MNIHLPAPRRRWPARLVNLAVMVVVLALAAATFVLSYSGVHAIALQAGVSARLARIYPGVFDAVLVVACAAAVSLREARWWARGYAWLAIIVVVGVLGAADAVHAMNVALQHKTMEGVVAAAPWVLALLGFSLMLTIFRHTRAQHAAAAAAPSGRAARRAAKQAAELSSRPSASPPAISAEPTPELPRSPVLAPALPPAATPDTPAPLTTPAQTAEATLADLPFAGDQTAATVVVPALAEPEAPLATAAAEHGDLDEPTAAEAIPTPEAAEAERPSWSTSYFAVADPDTAADMATDADLEPVSQEPATWHERVSDSGDDVVWQRDYWDSDDASADVNASPFAAAPFPAVPRLNRVRATPLPPEDEEE